jgi:hypothetical protein
LLKELCRRGHACSGKYGHALRLNYSYAWSPEIEAAVVTLGKLALRFAGGEKRQPEGQCDARQQQLRNEAGR